LEGGEEANMINADDKRRGSGSWVADPYLESYKVAVDHAFRLREMNTRMTREFFTTHIAVMERHAALNERVAQETVRLSREHSEALFQLSTGAIPKRLPPPRQP
jgi:hypothetical protein